ncbi:PHP domain-containing protein [Halpernia sp. GG3]
MLRKFVEIAYKSLEDKLNEENAENSAKKLIPILGCEFYISDRPEQKQFTKDDPDRRTNVVLLAKNFNGYKNLTKLSSMGFVNGFYFGVPRISRQMISEYKEDLIAVTSSLNGDIPDTILNFGNKKAKNFLNGGKMNLVRIFIFNFKTTICRKKII